MSQVLIPGSEWDNIPSRESASRPVWGERYKKTRYKSGFKVFNLH
jgi:hypothetical protein